MASASTVERALVHHLAPRDDVGRVGSTGPAQPAPNPRRGHDRVHTAPASGGTGRGKQGRRNVLSTSYVLEREVHPTEAREQRLVEGIARGDPMDPLLTELKVEESRKAALTQKRWSTSRAWPPWRRSGSRRPSSGRPPGCATCSAGTCPGYAG